MKRLSHFNKYKAVTEVEPGTQLSKVAKNIVLRNTISM